MTEGSTPKTLMMAPLKGFTDHLFRHAFTKYFNGFDIAVAPFIASKGGRTVKRKYVKDLWPENNTRLPVIPQILSKSAKDFILLANYLHDLGYASVNWNLGCPSPMVAGKKRGSGLLPHTEKIQWFLDEVIPGINGQLSIKIRLGWHSADEIFRLLPVLNGYPLTNLIIHPRTGVQRYDGTVDLEAFACCLDMAEHTIVYNGDIQSLDDFQKLSQRFSNVAHWMIGRGFIANPFLPSIIKTGQDTVKDKIALMQRFHQDLFEAYTRVLYGPAHVLNKMKGLWRYFSLPFADCSKAMKAIKKARHPAQYLERVNLFFETEARLRAEKYKGMGEG